MFNLQVTSTTMELLPLVCLCLLTRSGTTFAEEGSKVIRVEEDSDVTLPCSLSSKENISKMVFDWRKDGQKDVFLYDEGKHYNNGREGQDEQFKGRVSHFPDKLKHGDASIKINNTRVADSGDYTCEFPHLQPRQIFHIRLVVVGGLKDGPGPKVIRVNQGSDVTLPCSLSSMGNIEFKLFDWKKDGQKDVFLYDAGLHYNNGRAGQDEQFKGRVSHFPDKLKLGDASIKINNTKLTDSGDYTCAFPRLQPSQIFHIRLVVGAAPEPSVTILDETNDWSLLQCKVQGASPKPEVEWQDSAGNILPAGEPQASERGGRFYITLNTTVSKTDRYRCVATQEDISHQIYAETYVFISGPILTDGSGRILKDRSGENIPGAAPEPYVTSLNETNDWWLLQCKVQGASPKPKVEWQDSAGKRLPAEEPQVSERGGSYDIILQTTVTKTDRYRCVATQEDINHQTDATIYVHISGPILKDGESGFPTGLFFGGVLCALLVGGVVGGAVVSLARRYRRRRSTQNSQRGSQT
ncbi:butyrophilin-like protein 2 isoform X5 [Siniperca chuatsi]|uniref:butyrophilin-like protein 2 isoform X5 n=1 Tax=Siniperca chuatsi TaxID=119488 RepID=UPI001CE0990A|nr:butyrophilin-like protein 2 isoform X5 [Siniperca chuatsi]